MGQTRQNEVILSVLRQAGRPLTREEILQLGREKLERLGSATVDRAIRRMTEQFNLVGLDYPGQPKRYELPTDVEHPHFICRGCDRVFDLPAVVVLPEVQLPPGFELSGGEMIYSGHCPNCRK